MAYKINEECISCGACEPECKNAIKIAWNLWYWQTHFTTCQVWIN